VNDFYLSPYYTVLPGTVILSGRQGSNGFICEYNTSSNKWSSIATVSNTEYLEDAIWVASKNLFYIQNFNLGLNTSTAANVLIPSAWGDAVPLSKSWVDYDYTYSPYYNCLYGLNLTALTEYNFTSSIQTVLMTLSWSGGYVGCPYETDGPDICFAFGSSSTNYAVYYSTNGKTFTNTLNIPVVYSSSYSEQHIEVYVCSSQVVYISDEQDGNPASWIGFYNTTTWTLIQNYVGIESHTDMWLIFDKNDLILRQGEGGGKAEMYVIRASSLAHWMTASVSSYGASMNVGQSQTITCSVMGGIPPYTYQWYVNGIKIAGATSSSYVFTPSSTGHYNFYVNVTDSEYYVTNPNTYNFATSNTVTISVLTISGQWPIKFLSGPYYTQCGIEYWIVRFPGRRTMRIISNY
jgi:hypothetical protein